MPTPLGTEEDNYSDKVEDNSDIPVTTLANHIAARRCSVDEGFRVLEDRGLA